MEHLGAVISCIYSSSHMLSNLHPLSTPSCLGFNSLRLLNPNIWCSSCSKPENDPRNATQKNKLASLATWRQSLAPNLRLKLTSHPKSLKNHRGSGACSFRRYPIRQVAACNHQQHIHRSCRIKLSCWRL
jgi:hypothetical protein